MNAQSLIKVEYVDSEGRKSIRRVPQDMLPADYGMGILVGPPPLESMGFPEVIEVKLNNELFNRRLITFADVRRRPQDLFAALQATFKQDVQKIQRLYRDFEGG